MNSKAAVAEFIGTFTLVFIGAGAGALADANTAGLVGVALAHGLALMVIIYTWGSISGAHVNPAVTLGIFLSGRVNAATAVAYWIAQCAGGIAAAYLLLYLLGPESSLGSTIGSLTPVAAGQGDMVKTIVVEGVLTFFLVSSVFASGAYAKNGNMVGIAIGLVLTMDIIMGGTLTGASMNPARTLGPAVAKGQFNYFLPYLIGPFLGAFIAWLSFDKYFETGKSGA